MTSSTTASVRPADRLSPPLMHVFRAAHRDRREQAREAARRQALAREGGTPEPERKTRPQRAPINEQELKAEVEHDVAALMNHVSMDSTIDLSSFARVRGSILNYGFPDLANRTMDELEARDLHGEIIAVLKQYEPRLIPGSVRVTRDRSPEALQEIRYIVDGHLLCQPLNVPIEFVAKFEETTGKLHLTRR